MLLPIVGTIRNTVKMAILDDKWQQRKKSGGKAVKLEENSQIRQFKEDLQRMRENNQMLSISAKLKSGIGLTVEEIEYLKKNSPGLYREYLEAQREKADYERQLKNCKTKEEVERLRVNKMGSFMAEANGIIGNANIPEDKKLALMEKLLKKVMSVRSAHMDFVESTQYHDLPEKEEDLREENLRIELPEDKPEQSETGTDDEELRQPETATDDGRLKQPETATHKEGLNQPEITADKVRLKQNNTGMNISKVDVKYKEIETAVKKFLNT